MKPRDLSTRQIHLPRSGVPSFTDRKSVYGSASAAGTNQIFKPNAAGTAKWILVQATGGDVTVQLFLDGAAISSAYVLPQNSAVRFAGTLVPNNATLSLVLSAAVTVSYEIGWAIEFLPALILDETMLFFLKASGASAISGGMCSAIQLSQISGWSFASNVVITNGANNQVVALQIILPWKQTFRYGVWATSTTVPAAGVIVDYGIYSADGQTKLVSTGGVAVPVAANTVVPTTLATVVTLNPGVYWFAYTTNNNTVTANDVANGGLNFNLLQNLGTQKRLVFAGNAAVAGVMPSALGTLTAFANTNLFNPLFAA